MEHWPMRRERVVALRVEMNDALFTRKLNIHINALSNDIIVSFSKYG